MTKSDVRNKTYNDNDMRDLLVGAGISPWRVACARIDLEWCRIDLGCCRLYLG